MSRDSTIAIQFVHLMGLAPSFCAVFGQHAGRTPYTPRANVATQRQGCHKGKTLQCVAFHSFTRRPEFSRFLLRYPASSRSKHDEKLGFLTIHRRQCSAPYCLTRRHTRQQHQANTPPIGISASSALAVMSVSLVAQLRPRGSVFLTARHEINTQPRSPAASFIPCCAAGGGCHA